MRAWMRPLGVAMATAVAGLALTTAPAGAAAPTPWRPTLTGPAAVPGATAVTDPPASAPLHVTLTLAGRNRAGLDALVAAQQDPSSPMYHRYLTPAAFAGQFGATTAQLDAVTSYLRSQGLGSVTVAANHLVVTAGATVGIAGHAFHTTLRRYRTAKRTIIANATPAEVPPALSGTVQTVLGLDQTPVAVPHVVRHTDEYPGQGTLFTGPQLADAYDASGLSPATSVSMAVMAEGNINPVISDLRAAEASNGQPGVPVTVVPAPYGGSDLSNQDEWDIDTQASTAMADNVQRLYVYDAPDLDEASVVNEIELFASQDVAQAGSASYGICDDKSTYGGAAAATDLALEEAAAQGQSFFTSSGDEGSDCAYGDNETSPNETSFPASSAYAVGVGGTSLLATGGAAGDGYTSENAWSGSGGGLSYLDAQPAYQRDAVANASPNVQRGVPDIAMDADPDTGLLVDVDGEPVGYGGTSLAAPLALGTWTRINAAHAGALGPAGPDLYALYNAAWPTATASGATPGLHDITSGSNGDYTAKTGYDLVTGLGSIDATALSTALTPLAPAGDAAFDGSAGNIALAAPIVGMAADPVTGGYWLTASDGGVFAFNAPFLGSAATLRLTKPVVGMAATPDGKGYYLVAADGGIFNYGDAAFHGSAGGLRLTKPVVGMAADPKTGGYWLVAADGGIFNYGAPFEGSAGGLRLTKPVVGMAATPDDAGYHLAAADGGIFAYGDAAFHGSAGGFSLPTPVVGIASDDATGGYWMVGADGRVLSFGAPTHGSAAGLPLARPVVGVAATADSGGYWLAASDGGIFNY